jgi:hypothetical protein
MLDPIPTFAMQLIVSGQNAELVNGLCAVLRNPIAWQPRSPEPMPQDTRMWEANVGDWQLVLVDFDISTQPKRKPGDRGQNVTMSNKKSGLIVMSDGIMQHEVARWLLERMDQYGGGKSDAAWKVKG